MTSGIFDSARYETVMRPLDQARMLPSFCYTSPEWQAREVERLFRRGWHVVGRPEQVPNPGDFFTFDLAGELVLVVRGRDGQVRAFSPVCRHRGAIVATGKGRCTAFLCPYHHWSYGLDGKLLNAPHMGPVDGAQKPADGLRPMALELWQGFLFVNLSGDVSSVEAQFGALEPILAKYRLDDMRFTRQKVYSLQCNWKAYVDNSVEAYHVPSVHRRSLEPVAPLGLWHTEPHDRYFLLYGEFAGSLGVLKGESGFPPMNGFSADAIERHDLAILLPNTIVTCTIDSMWWVTVIPNGTERSTVYVNHAFPATLLGRPDFVEVAQRYYDRFDVVNLEDNDIVELQHRGFGQTMRIPGPYAPQEELVHAFARYLVTSTLDKVG